LLQGIFAQFGPGADQPEDAIREGASKNLSDTDFLATEAVKWLHGTRRKLQLKGTAYYEYDYDFADHTQYTRDPDGAPVKVDTKKRLNVIDNQYANMVDQKANYILGKPFSLQTKDEKYTDALNLVFDKTFKRMLHSVATDSLNGGIAWVHPYYNNEGELVFRNFPAHEIFPFWADDGHTVLDMAIRYYTSIVYVDRTETTVQHIEVYSRDGIQRYILSGGKLIADKDLPEIAYASAKDEDGNDVKLSWDKIPLVAFKYNQHEIPLIRRVMNLQDALNNTRSNWSNSMNEDIRDTILILKNYEGEDIADFRKKLMLYGAVKVTDDGGVDTLRIERDSESYTTYLKDTKRAIIENARGFDAKDDRMSQNPNEMNLRSMYSDIDLDADTIELQFQAAFDQLLWFVDQYLATAGRGDFLKEEVTFTFNRNMIVNDADTINNIKNSVGIVSNETLLAHHPYVSDVQAELDRKKKEQEQSPMAQMGNYPSMNGSDGEGGSAS